MLENQQKDPPQEKKNKIPRDWTRRKFLKAAIGTASLAVTSPVIAMAIRRGENANLEFADIPHKRNFEILMQQIDYIEDVILNPGKYFISNEVDVPKMQDVLADLVRTYFDIDPKYVIQLFGSVSNQQTSHAYVENDDHIKLIRTGLSDLKPVNDYSQAVEHIRRLPNANEVNITISFQPLELENYGPVKRTQIITIRKQTSTLPVVLSYNIGSFSFVRQTRREENSDRVYDFYVKLDEKGNKISVYPAHIDGSDNTDLLEYVNPSINLDPELITIFYNLDTAYNEALKRLDER